MGKRIVDLQNKSDGLQDSNYLAIDTGVQSFRLSALQLWNYIKEKVLSLAFRGMPSIILGNISGTVSLNANTIYKNAIVAGNTVFSLPTPSDDNFQQEIEVELIFGGTVYTLNFGTNKYMGQDLAEWQPEANKKYSAIYEWNGSFWYVGILEKF